VVTASDLKTTSKSRAPGKATSLDSQRSRAMPGRTEPQTSRSMCSCGGGCPRCAGRSLNNPNDRSEQHADVAAESALHNRHVTGWSESFPTAADGRPHTRALPPTLRAGLETHLGVDLGGTRLHTGGEAAQSAAGLRANAYTVGQDIVFGNRQFDPGTQRGQRLITHELAHVAQQSQSGQQQIQRQPSDVVNMEPLTVTSTLQPTGSAVPGLANLTGEGRTAGDVTLSHDEAAIARNAPDPSRALPFNGSGWDGQAIMSALGQYDTLPGTDSDAIRCVQAVAMAARIPDGPDGVTGFLRANIMDGMMSRPQGPRQRTAIDVLEHVIGRIEMRHATFQDLMWAQEALHDLFYNDVGGTPEADIRTRMAPGLEFGRSLQRMDVWCDTPDQVIAQANLLQPGEQLMVNTWQVILNTTFDDLSEQGIEVAEGQSTVVEINGRRVRIRRIRTDVRPDHTAIDNLRDHRGGHQLLVLRDGATRQLRLYEPEITDSGRHLEDLAADGSNFQRYFNDQPNFGIYNYIEILGKLVPSGVGAGSTTTPAAP
jgi:hypothetical protein